MTYIISAQAQYDNLGDMVIRSTLVEWLSTRAKTIAVVGDAPIDYVDGLRMDPNVEVVRSIGSALWKTRGESVTLCFAPGEQALDLGVKGWPKAIANLALATFVRLRRGNVIKVGRGYRGEQKVLKLLESRLLALTERKYVRDVGGLHLFPGTVLMPDIALASTRFGMPDKSSRSKVAFCLRSDRPRPLESIQLAANQVPELDPLVVVQVRRDADASREVADANSWDVLEWEGTMENQLTRVREAYNGCQYVISDRLHSLLFGLLCGAVPVGVETGSHGKLRRQLATIGLDHLVVDSWDSPELSSILNASYTLVSSSTRDALTRARGQLNDVRYDVAALYR